MGYALAKQAELDERRKRIVARVRELRREKRACAVCVSGGARGRCKEPHTNPTLTTARELGISRDKVWRDLELIKTRWLLDNPEVVEEKLDEQESTLAWVETQAREQWERSKLDAVREEKEASNGAKDARKRSKRVTEGQCGDPRYLDIVLKVAAHRREMYGLNAPKKLTATNADGDDIFALMAQVAKQAIDNCIDITPTSIALPAPEDLDVADVMDMLGSES